MMAISKIRYMTQKELWFFKSKYVSASVVNLCIFLLILTKILTYLFYLCASLRFCIESVDCILLSYKDIKYHSWSHYDAVCGKIKHTESKLHEWSVVVKCTFYPSTVMVKKDETATLYHCCCSTLKNKKSVRYQSET